MERVVANNQSCLTLLVSWILLGSALLLAQQFGQLGLVAGLVPIGIAQRLRLAHDRALLERVRTHSGWITFILLYYAIFGVVVVVSAVKGIKLYHLPLVMFLLVIFFPILVACVVNDLKTCAAQKKGS